MLAIWIREHAEMRWSPFLLAAGQESDIEKTTEFTKSLSIDFCTIPCFSLWSPFLLAEEAAPQKSVSSTVGAPCNEVTLCNRAGWLGVGYVPRIG